MKEDNGSQDVGSTAFDLPNSQHPNYTNHIHYGPQFVPKPINRNAECVDAHEIMRHVLGK